METALAPNPAQLINQTSGEFEYFTPRNIIMAARQTMGSIDLDPASSLAAANFTGIQNYYSEDGLDRPWQGNVWLNHPFGRGRNRLWIARLISQFENGHIEQACCITYACTSEKWFQPLWGYPVCFLVPRTNYHLPDGTLKTGVTKGSVVTYLGRNRFSFWAAFEHLGHLVH